MQLGVSSYSFGRLVRGGALKQLDVIAKAREIGFDAIEFSTISVPEGKGLPEFAAELKAEASRVGLPIVNYTIGADFISGSNGDIQAEIERVKAEVDVAKILGVKGMRHDASRGFPENHKGARGFDDALPRLVQGCRAVTEYAAAQGIKTMVENHGYFCQDSERVEKLINGVNHPNFGILIDVGNFLCADEDPGLAVGRLMPYAFHCHAKDFHVKPGTSFNPGAGWFMSRGGNYLRGSIVGHGDVPLVTCIRIFKRAKYDGVLSIEFEGMEEPIQGISVGLANLRRLVAEVN